MPTRTKEELLNLISKPVARNLRDLAQPDAWIEASAYGFAPIVLHTRNAERIITRSMLEALKPYLKEVNFTLVLNAKGRAVHRTLTEK